MCREGLGYAFRLPCTQNTRGLLVGVALSVEVDRRAKEHYANIRRPQALTEWLAFCRCFKAQVVVNFPTGGLCHCIVLFSLIPLEETRFRR